MTNPLAQLHDYGQSAWLDSIRRGLIEAGDLEAMRDHDRLGGVTSNPAIFEKAMGASSDYRTALAETVEAGVTDAEALYEALAITDIRSAADLFGPRFEATGGRDGLVSLEVSPRLARDTEGTVSEARRLWAAVGRPNAMIKVPATEEGIPAIETLIADGINVNVTLLFGRPMYRRAAEAYLRGLERRAEAGLAVDGIASVASFFLSRIDAALDKGARSRLEHGQTGAEAALAQVGHLAVANAKMAYQDYGELFAGDRWQRLARQGAQPQWLLWASTGSKDPDLSDVHYIENLIGPDTVTTIPPGTYEAFRDHGRVGRTVDSGLEEAQQVLATVDRAGIDLEALTDDLLADGIGKFEAAYDRLLCAVDGAKNALALPAAKSHSFHLPAGLEERVQSEIQTWKDEDRVARLWQRDASLWTGTSESDWMGWLCATEECEAQAERLKGLAYPLAEHFDYVLLLGMGGSSLAPQVLAETFGSRPYFPELKVLDSTVPAQVRAAEEAVDLDRTLFLVSSKSGTTLEPDLFLDYFYERVAERQGREIAGHQFMAITDPGSALESRARELGFRQVFYGIPSIGGRYSALSNFGLVPGALMGADVAEVLERGEEMVQACSSCVPVEENPAVGLGAFLGVLANAGRDKLTVVTSPEVRGFGAWLEQLLAESTGKEGRGIIPVHGEQVAPPDYYDDDRMFVCLGLGDKPDADLEADIQRLQEAGQPVAHLHLNDAYDLGREFFRWEMATAVAGAIMGINPFDQPDVEASKQAARELTERYVREGTLPEGEPLATETGSPLLGLYADETGAKGLRRRSGDDSLGGLLRAHLDRLEPDDYCALLAYLPQDPEIEQELSALRHRIRDSKGVATCLGFGPQYLHSTGQAHKGGPAKGVFLELTARDPDTLAIPGRDLDFHAVSRAQALGDLQVLAERGQRPLRIDLGADPGAGLAHLGRVIQRALN
ncbi:bifunctional transaldolase/phosoglucose isomerase [Thiohalorhabdus sp.]|uniref:bifunctional transaldolase/phosoglucose isomerase n=1 Tax=Thiohalorhabdus sp. TaxID=3094134 RepID=UPI002FC38F1A